MSAVVDIEWIREPNKPITSGKFTARDYETGKLVTIVLQISPDQYSSWVNGALIQNAMPHLSKDDREFLMTGILPGRWNAVIPPESA